MCDLNMLRRMLAVILVMSFLLREEAVSSSCRPAEEGQSYGIQCKVPVKSTSIQIISWRSNDTVDITCQCRSDDWSCRCLEQDFNATINLSGNNLISDFIIRSPIRSQAGIIWICSEGGEVEEMCEFKVFARAQSVTCRLEDLKPASNTVVTVTCETSDIYPPPACLFYTNTNESIERNLTEGTIQPGEKSCTLRVAGDKLSIGDHKFGVFMYPSVTGSVTDMEYGKKSNETSSIKIGYPSAELSQCLTASSDGSPVLDAYIKNGTSHNCTCIRTDQTYFPVAIIWVGHTQSTTLTFTAEKNQAFTCRATNSLQWTKEVMYTPQVAYGPGSVDVTLKPPSQEPVDLCQAASVSFTVQCQVSPSGVVPSATFSYTVNTTTSVVPQTPVCTGTSSATVTVRQAGTSVITCLAKNSEFDDIHTQNSVSVVVREPPSAPIIDVSQSTTVSPTTDDILTVEEGGASVTCHVTGGYPQVTELKLSCGKDETFPNQGNQAQMGVNFTRKMNGLSCSCEATHDSTCYNNRVTTNLLNVLYPPAVLNFSTNGDTSSMTVEKDSTLTFVCEAEGNPSPRLSLQHDGSDVTNDRPETSLRHSLTVDCLDTGVYTCTAQAERGDDRKTVEVYVLCPQQLESSQSQNEVHEGQVNGTFYIYVAVYGHPKPTSLQLHGHKKDLQPDDYNLTYTEIRPPQGIVTVRFYSLKETFFQNYTLTVTNTEGSLVYYFSISSDIGSSDTDKSTDAPVGAIVGGVIAGVVAILVVALAVFFVQRRGHLNKNKNNDETGTDMHRIPSASGDEPMYENTVSSAPTSGATGKPNYENVVSGVSRSENVGGFNNQDVTRSTQTSQRDKFWNNEEGISGTDGVVEYENTIQSNEIKFDKIC